MTWGFGARPATPERPKVHRVLMSFHYSNGWRITFFDDDRTRSALPHRAFCHDDETWRSFNGQEGPRASDTRFYIEEAIKRGHGEVTLELAGEQYDVLRMRRSKS